MIDEIHNPTIYKLISQPQQKIMSPSTQNMRFFKWGETKTNKATTDIGYQQKLNEFPAQLELEVKEIDDGLKEDKSKPKKKK